MPGRKPPLDTISSVLIRLACDRLSARRTMGIEDVSHKICDAVAASRAPSESAAFTHEVELVADWQNEHAGDGIVCGVSGWFGPHGV